MDLQEVGVSRRRVDIDSLRTHAYPLCHAGYVRAYDIRSHGKPCLSMVGSAVPQQEGLSQYLQEWCDVKMDLLHGRITKTQYDDWRYNYPRLKREKRENEITYTPLESVIEEPASAS